MKIVIDEKEYSFEKGLSINEMAKQILGADEKKVVAGKIDGKLIDLFIPIEKDCKIDFVFLSSKEGVNVYRHTAAHVMAHAIQTVFPTAKLTIGPAVEDGFYYDVDFMSPISYDDLPKIEAEMKKIVKANFRIERKEISRKEAIKMAKDDNEPFKLELIDAIPEGEKITIYTQGEWYDICRGPHLRSTGMLKAFKLTKLAGAYWRGDEKNKMLTRIYGVAFETKQELDEYFVRMAEAEKRDHRKLGPALDLFFFHETAPGSPYWLPRGWKLFNNLLDFWREVHEETGYIEVSMPLINNAQLWKTSGHWEHYKENMFVVEKVKEFDENQYAVKPMSCPNAMLIYKTKIRSYRDLPLRICDCDVIHRFEKSGTLDGLKRVRTFRQDDSHNFITFDQIEAEFEHLFDLADKFYSVFGISYVPRLSTRPEKFLGKKSVWDKAEGILFGILNRRFGKGNYEIDEGGGAFYGPKIDIDIKDAIGRSWQTGTFQLDMQLPERFDLFFTDKDGQRKVPVVVHRAIYGSFERFIGILIEQFTGAFPFWIAPSQVAIVPVNDENIKYAEEVYKKLKAIGVRSEIDKGDSSMGAKIKNFTLLKVPYVLVLGNKEQQNKTVSVRLRGGKQVADVDFAAFKKAVQKLISSKQIDLLENFD